MSNISKKNLKQSIKRSKSKHSTKKSVKTKSILNLKKEIQQIIKKKAKGAKNIADTYTVIFGHYEPYYLLRFSKKQGKMHVKISKIIGKKRKYLGEYIV